MNVQEAAQSLMVDTAPDENPEYQRALEEVLMVALGIDREEARQTLFEVSP